MDRQIMKGVRLPKPLLHRIEQIIQADGSTFSQFMRTAAIKALQKKERA